MVYVSFDYPKNKFLWSHRSEPLQEVPLSTVPLPFHVYWFWLSSNFLLHSSRIWVEKYNLIHNPGRINCSYSSGYTACFTNGVYS